MRESLQFPAPVASLQVYIAETREELLAAYRLAYRCYVERELISPNSTGLIYRRAFGHKRSRTIIAVDDERRVVGTVTVVGDNPHGLQLEDSFAAEVDSLRARGSAVAELTCLAIDPNSGNAPTAVFFALTRFMIQYARHAGFDDLIIAVHPHHVKFYKRRFAAEEIAFCDEHGPVNDLPAVACRINLHVLAEVTRRELYEQYFGEPIAAYELNAPAIEPADHAHLLALADCGAVAAEETLSTRLPIAA